MAVPGEQAGEPAHVTVAEKGGYAVLTVRREPVNAMHAALWEQLQAALDACEANPAVRCVRPPARAPPPAPAARRRARAGVPSASG